MAKKNAVQQEETAEEYVTRVKSDWAQAVGNCVEMCAAMHRMNIGADLIESLKEQNCKAIENRWTIIKLEARSKYGQKEVDAILKKLGVPPPGKKKKR